MRLLFIAPILLALAAAAASAEPPLPPSETETDILDEQLDQLESRVIQRQDRPPRTRDRLTDSDLGVAERKLNALKTRQPQNAQTPLMERQLDRARRPISPRRVDEWRPAVR